MRTVRRISVRNIVFLSMNRFVVVFLSFGHLSLYDLNVKESMHTQRVQDIKKMMILIRFKRRRLSTHTEINKHREKFDQKKMMMDIYKKDNR